MTTFWTNRFLGMSFASVFQERVADHSAKPTNCVARPNLSPYAPSMIPMDYDDGIPYGGWILSLKIFKLLLIAQGLEMYLLVLICKFYFLKNTIF